MVAEYPANKLSRWWLVGLVVAIALVVIVMRLVLGEFSQYILVGIAVITLLWAIVADQVERRRRSSRDPSSRG